MDSAIAPPSLAGSRPRRTFALLWSASVLSALGDGIRDVAMPLVAAGLTRDPAGVAAVYVAGRAPWLLCSPATGVLADRWDRRRAMAAVDVLRCAAAGGLAVGIAAGAVGIPLLVAVAFLLGAGQTLVDNAAHAWLPDVVGAGALEGANGRLESGLSIARDMAGPALGGLLFALSPLVPFGVDAVTFAVAAGLILATSRGGAVPHPFTEKEPFRTAIAVGARWLWSHRLLRRYWLIAAAVNAVVGAGLSVIVLLALERLGLPAGAVGLLLSTQALGGFVGGFLAGRLHASFGTGRVTTACIAGAGLSLLGLGLTRSAIVAGLCLSALATMGTVFSVASTSLRQRLAPDALRGRVNGASRFLTYGALALGGVAGAALARGAGLQAPFLAGAGVLTVLALVSSGMELDEG